MKKLQIGDKIYATNDYGVNCVMTIARITPTLAITDRGDKFKINTNNEFCVKTPKDDSWSSNGRTYYQLETPELKEILQKQRFS